MRTALVIVAIALLPTAGAAAEPLESGAAVELQLDSGLAKTLKREGVRLNSLKPAHAGEAGVADAVQSMKLTRRSALALNRLLGLRKVFRPGRSLGTGTARDRFEWLTVTGGEVTLTADSGFAEKLHSVDAEALPSSLSVPLYGGRITSALGGFVHAESGISLIQHDSSPYGEPFESAGEPLGTVSFVARTR